jgi:hypothetical protein
VDPLAEEVLFITALSGCMPFLIGILTLAAALIWGRRKPPPDVATVFS